MAKSRTRRRPRVAGPSLKGLRTCLGCRERFLRDELVRVICSPDGEVGVDRHLRAPGRGAHLCYDRGCVAKAVERGAFGRAFRRAVSAVSLEDLMKAIEDGIEARIMDALSLGRRANKTVSGMDVLARQRERIRLVVLATDVAAGTEEKLRRTMETHSVPIWVFGDSARLGESQGKARRVAIGVTDGRLAERLSIEFTRRDRVSVAG